MNKMHPLYFKGAFFMILFISDCIFASSASYKESFSGYIVVKDGIIEEINEGSPSIELKNSADEVIDARGKTILPGFVDSHTHLVHGGSRENELAMKLKGASYMELHKVGGIGATVKATRKATEAELYNKAFSTLDNMLLHGVTTVEAKSGYGLDLETEIKCLKVNRKLNETHPIDLISTYMGAHSTPPEFVGNTDGYIDFMIKEVMPKVKSEGLAEFCDAFCEEGIFSLEQTEKVLKAAKDMGFKLKLHADEIVPFNGAELAAKMGSVSAEHLMAVSDNGIKAMAQSGTVAVLLPATSFFLMSKVYAPAKKMLSEGVKVAISTDYNPGSSPTENIQMAMWVACFKMGLTPQEIIRGVCINASYAVTREKTIGSLEKGKNADIVIFNSPSIEYIMYRFGSNLVSQVWKNGRLVVKDGKLIY